MAKVTEKNTKKEILEALREVEAKLAERRAVVTTTADTVKAAEVVAKKATAKEIIEMNILNDEITNKYNDLLSTIDVLTKEIEELHEIKVGLDTLEALLIVQNQKKTEFDADLAERKANFETEMLEKKAAAKEEIENLKNKYDLLLKDLQDEYASAKKKLELERKRDQEEYTYNLDRKRSKENDSWNDQKAKREKELADKEIAVKEREAAVAEKDQTIANLNAEIEALKAQMVKDVAEALKQGESKAEKTCAIKIAAIEKDSKWQAEVLKKEIASLREFNDEKTREAQELRTKLDDAYTRIQEMALEQAKASTPRVIETVK